MRLLLVTHPPLDGRLGAAQLALELGGALRERGHEVTLWSTTEATAAAGLPYGPAAEEHLLLALLRGSTFDAIDIPATSLTPAVAARGFTIARSFQPELQYLRADLLADLRRASPRLPAHLWRALRQRRRLLRGWRLADRILCLGTLERDWMARRYPQWNSKLFSYGAAPARLGHDALVALRAARRAPASDGRILWLGRWAAHKGTALLRRLVETRGELRRRGLTLAGCGDAPARRWPRDWFTRGIVRVVPDFAPAELPTLLAQHAVGLFTSTSEGWGLSLSEMLESGMTVYATDAGAVRDLRAYFPDTLRPLAAEERFAAHPPEALHETGYLSTFTWPAIAARYEAELLVQR